MNWSASDAIDWVLDRPWVMGLGLIAVIVGATHLSTWATARLRNQCESACAPSGGAWSRDLSTCMCIDDNGKKSLRAPDKADK